VYISIQLLFKVSDIHFQEMCSTINSVYWIALRYGLVTRSSFCPFDKCLYADVYVSYSSRTGRSSKRSVQNTRGYVSLHAAPCSVCSTRRGYQFSTTGRSVALHNIALVQATTANNICINTARRNRRGTVKKFRDFFDINVLCAP
jgi:hypothetical protein